MRKALCILFCLLFCGLTPTTEPLAQGGAIDAQLAQVERVIVLSPVEIAVGDNAAGDPQFCLVGSATQVDIPWLSGLAVYAGYITHNHPGLNAPAPSWLDYELARKYNLVELRAVAVNAITHKIEHRILRRIAHNWGLITWSDFAATTQQVFADRQIAITQVSKRFVVARYSQAMIDASDAVWLSLAPDHGFIYEGWGD